MVWLTPLRFYSEVVIFNLSVIYHSQFTIHHL